MIHSKPPLFVKITPVNPDEVTVVDLEGEMGRVPVPVARHSSLPPSPTRAEYSTVARHGSLPPATLTLNISSPVEGAIEEVDSDNSDDSEPERVGVTEPPSQNSNTLRVQDNPARVG
jgi:hypothetical protein